MKTFIYFSYGSNMLTERLEARCPSAIVIGAARLAGYGLRFTKLSDRDMSAKATIAPAVEERVFGVLYEIDLAELADLDRAEGAPKGYRRVELDGFERLSDRARQPAITYVEQPDHHDPKLRPYDWYLALVLAGARQNDLPADYIDGIAAQAFAVDPDPERKTRNEALVLLEKAGFTADGDFR
ncbi:gamma-glutamylcyclotransferase family protein [Martelella endophytica]|uniref:Gamma-glutamylcyclotransferase n=1 Tax=Martelella endophytica TaxID=1486262 RepID=A0A0D5LKI9_MAREN|nr:gamma-glutamylcyclotransferase family protein [Martelella endophytica]AJY44714.1 hypothetical protein TM49_01910 [Martelella endophytica]